MIDENGCFAGMEYVLKEGPKMGRPDHYFNPSLAEAYGVDVAIFLHNIFHWVSITKRTRKIFMREDIGLITPFLHSARYILIGASVKLNELPPRVKRMGYY